MKTELTTEGGVQRLGEREVHGEFAVGTYFAPTPSRPAGPAAALRGQLSGHPLRQPDGERLHGQERSAEEVVRPAVRRGRPSRPPTLARWPRPSGSARAAGRRGAGQALVPARRLDRGGAARLLRRALRHRRGRLALLPPARSRGDRDAGRSGHRDDFVFHVKAHAAMTRAQRGRARGGVRASSATRSSRSSCRGSCAASCCSTTRAFEEVGRGAGGARRVRALLDPLVPLVEFRHRSWLEPDERADTLAFLEQHGCAYVSVDAPRTRASNVVPRVAAATHRVAYVRFHGRNWKTWNIRGARDVRRALRLDVLGGGARASGSSRSAASPARPTRSTRSSTTTATTSRRGAP